VIAGWALFALGWVGLSVIVVAPVVVGRAVRYFDREGPGTRNALRSGCRCSPWKNWGGWREALTGTSILARRCPIIRHHPEVRRRMYNERV
jgi:hypothetical protein